MEKQLIIQWHKHEFNALCKKMFGFRTQCSGSLWPWTRTSMEVRVWWFCWTRTLNLVLGSGSNIVHNVQNRTAASLPSPHQRYATNVLLHVSDGSMQQGEVPSLPNTLSVPLSSGITMLMGSATGNQHINLVFTFHQSINPNPTLLQFTQPRL
jgi:hypothetical protein